MLLPPRSSPHLHTPLLLSSLSSSVLLRSVFPPSLHLHCILGRLTFLCQFFSFFLFLRYFFRLPLLLLQACAAEAQASLFSSSYTLPTVFATPDFSIVSFFLFRLGCEWAGCILLLPGSLTGILSSHSVVPSLFLKCSLFFFFHHDISDLTHTEFFTVHVKFTIVT